MKSKHKIQFTINGKHISKEAESRLLLVDLIRNELGLTGTRVGCEHGVCGACTIIVEGDAVRSCLMFAVQANGLNIETVESLAKSMDELHPLQESFREAHGLQCGFCTSGMLMTLIPFLAENSSPTELEIREAISGNLCRCTGYQHIVDSVLLAAKK